MPEQGAQEKTEKPTPRRRSKAREKGQVAKSQEMGSAAVLLSGMATLWLFGGYIYRHLIGMMRHMFTNLDAYNLSEPTVHHLSLELQELFFKVITPIWIVLILAGIAVSILQVGFLLAPQRLKPDLSRINPIKGFQKFFTMRLLVDVGKNLGKVAVVAGAAWYAMDEEWAKLPHLIRLDVPQIVLYILGICFKIFFQCTLAFLVLALLDWAYQKYDFEKNLKMSKQEIKDEHKQTEGDPQVKSRIRSIQREVARKRMMNEVPRADVVITNPTHLAVALRYRLQEMEAPTVVAKGAGKIAERIKAIAKEHDVPIIEDKPLAQVLYKQVEVGQMIPADMYETVATVLAHVYRKKNQHRQFLQGAAKPAGA